MKYPKHWNDEQIEYADHLSELICPRCAGSGIGQTQDTRCAVCKGSGAAFSDKEIIKTVEDNIGEYNE